jgi:hypothetical protein
MLFFEMFKEYEESSFLQEKTKATNNKLKTPELTEEDMPVV